MTLPRTARRLGLALLGAALAGLGAALPPAPAAAAGCVTLAASSITVASGQSATLDLTASGVSAPGLAGFTVTLTYDPTLLTVESVQPGPDFPDAVPNTEQAGSTTIAAAEPTGYTGNLVLAAVNVRATGTSTLSIGTSDLVDASLNPITTCTGAGSGTVNVTSAVSPVQVTSTLLPAGTTGTSYSQTLSATGGTGAYTWAVTQGALPPGLNVDPVTGALSGLPTTSGQTSFTVTATDSASHTASQALQLLIKPAGATLAVTSSSLQGGSVGTPYTANLSASGGTAPYSWTVQGSLPAGLGLSGATISGTPTTVGTTNFTLQVADSSSPQQIATLPVAIVVAPASVTVTTVQTATTTSVNIAATATVANTTAKASGGTGTVTTSQYTGNPETSSAQSFQAGGSYFDVNVSPESAFQTLVIQQCSVTPSDTLYWWNGTIWAAVSPQSYASGCISATLATSGTSPTIAELTGTAFAAAATASASGSGSAGEPYESGSAAGQVCTPTTSSQAATQSVGAAGGVLATVDGAFTMTVPAGALTSALSVSESTTAPAGLPTGLTAASPVFTLTGGTLSSPQAVTIKVSSSANGVSIYQQGGQDGWTFLPTAASGSTASAFVSGPATLVALANSQTMSDVDTSFWAAPDIDTLLAAGVVSGFPDGTFQPNATLTRAELVKIVDLALGLAPGSATTSFADVAAGDWFAPYVAAAVQAGLVQGTSATTFSPNAPVTREQLAVLLARALKLSGTAPLTYQDASSIDAWAAPSVQAAVAAGYMTGFPDGTFQPLGASTRAQAAKVLAEVIAHMAPQP